MTLTPHCDLNFPLNKHSGITESQAFRRGVQRQPVNLVAYTHAYVSECVRAYVYKLRPMNSRYKILCRDFNTMLDTQLD